MALTRKFLSAMGIEEDKIEQIISSHAETVDGLKDEIASLKEKTANADELQKKLTEAEKKLSEVSGDETEKEKFDKLKTEYDNYKKDVETKEAHNTKLNAYRDLLKQAGISEKHIDAVLKVSSATIDGLKIKDGKIENSDKLAETAKTEWADFITTTTTKPSGEPDNPPAGAKPIDLSSVKSMSVSDINKNWDSIKETLKGAKETN